MKTKKCSHCKKDLPIDDFYACQNKTFCYCKKCSSERNRIWYQKNKRQLIKRGNIRHIKRRLEIIDLLGGKCVKCGIKDIRVLCIDHKNGNGKIERKFMGGSGLRCFILKKIKVGSKDYQLLCFNCNWIKALENQEIIKK